ncbi:MAG: DUF3368 domain-containing protein [Anaerolineae bacterium]
MPVVSDTSPLLNLAVIGRLSLLRHQFGTVIIPPAVLAELRVAAQLPGSLALRRAVEDGWLRTEPVRDQALVKALRRDLDQGEAEAIALALALKADWLLLDEQEARKAAKALGLNVTGVLGILLRAKHQGQLLSMRVAMEELQEKAGFRIGQDLCAALLRQASE